MERAQKLFVNDQKIMIDAIQRKVKVPLLQQEYDALFSMTFNAGSGGALNEIALEINKGRYDTFPDFIKSYRLGQTKPEGSLELASCRLSEANIFQHGVYDASY